VTKRLRRATHILGIDHPGRLESIVNGLFPSVDLRPASVTKRSGSAIQFTVAEIQAVAKQLPNGEAPGPDGISNELLKVAVSCDPHRFAVAFNRCLSVGHFPKNLKRGQLVLIPKPGKPLD